MESTYAKNKFVSGVKKAILDSDGRMDLNDLLEQHQRTLVTAGLRFLCVLINYFLILCMHFSDPVGAVVTSFKSCKSTLRKMKNNVERMSAIADECEVCFEKFDNT